MVGGEDGDDRLRVPPRDPVGRVEHSRGGAAVDRLDQDGRTGGGGELLGDVAGVMPDGHDQGAALRDRQPDAIQGLAQQGPGAQQADVLLGSIAPSTWRTSGRRRWPSPPARTMAQQSAARACGSWSRSSRAQSPGRVASSVGCVIVSSGLAGRRSNGRRVLARAGSSSDVPSRCWSSRFRGPQFVRVLQTGSGRAGTDGRTPGRSTRSFLPLAPEAAIVGDAGRAPEVVDEAMLLGLAILLIRDAEDRGGMMVTKVR